MLAILKILKDNWQLIAVLLLAAAVWLHGDHHGAARVNAEWTADKLAHAEELAAAKAKAAEDARKASEAHQADLVKMRQTITQYERLVQYEIKRSYSSCVFTPELVRLWEKSFGYDTTVPGQP